MTKFFAIATFHSRVVKVLEEIAWGLLLQFREEIFVLLHVLGVSGLQIILSLIVCRDGFRDETMHAGGSFRIRECFLCLQVFQRQMAAKVSVTFERATGRKQIWIAT